MISISIKKHCNPTKTKNLIFRSYKNFDPLFFNNDLEQVPFNVANVFDDIYWAHGSLLKQVVNDHAPVKVEKPKRQSPPYMNAQYRKLIY
ncbi:hypothetical protein DPMN_134235 [Dreissena polymorpha]|uniref:Uncharacterized protein n=1 Tax=Dreissena polymorpha TaxID=45954 RepID=A0A9D4JBQ8_DREPO|nr:hypothetical protein DPMN_134235 [Dreissena polymorpha]